MQGCWAAQAAGFLQSVRLLREAVSAAVYADAQVVVDATFGHGYWSRSLLDNLPPTGRVVALDRNVAVLPQADAMKKAYNERFHFSQGNFDELRTHLQRISVAHPLLLPNPTEVDSVVVDLTEPTAHLRRTQSQAGPAGASYTYKQQLRGRLDPLLGTKLVSTPLEMINAMTQAELRTVLNDRVPDKWARRVAFKLCRSRRMAYFASLKRVLDIVAGAVP
eukprot:RCo036592